MKPFLLIFVVVATANAQQPNPKKPLTLEQQSAFEKQSVADREVLHKADREIAAKLSTITKELANQTQQVKEALAEKDMSRVALLEQQVKAIEDERNQRAAQVRADHDAYVAWFRGIGGGVVTSLVLTLLSVKLSSLREARHTAQVKAVANQIEVLKTQTDGMVEKMQVMATAKGFDQGKKAGVVQERAHPTLKPEGNQ
jgi:hypothetical protein